MAGLELATFFRRVLFVLGAILLQVSICPKLALFGVQPDVLLLALYVFSLRHGSLPAVWMGFAVGLILDVYSAGVLGTFGLSYALISFLVGLLDERKVWTGYGTRVALLGVACIFHDFLWALISRHDAPRIGAFLLLNSLPAAAYTLIFGAIFFAVRPAQRLVE